MQLRERERPEISLANESVHGHLCVTAAVRGDAGAVPVGVALSHWPEYRGRLQPPASPVL